MSKKRGRRYQRYPVIDTPPAVLKAARTLTGWVLASHVTTLQHTSDDIRVKLTLAHRGGFIVPRRPFLALDGQWIVTSFHSHVDHGRATVWLHLRRLPDVG